jgi:hypothetical protein
VQKKATYIREFGWRKRVMCVRVCFVIDRKARAEVSGKMTQVVFRMTLTTKF